MAYDKVRFSYDDRAEALRGIDLRLPAGTVTALVGASGSGKSTLARLLPRFWDVTGGRITVGGVDVRHIPAADLYRAVSFVLQDVQLLRTTVRDNIRLAVPDADDASVRAAARAAQIDERIMALPRGYDSVIGEDARLSGGEAQRVSIARALLADAPVLVLDEATAFADPASEAAIQDALAELTARGRHAPDRRSCVQVHGAPCTGRPVGSESCSARPIPAFPAYGPRCRRPSPPERRSGCSAG